MSHADALPDKYDNFFKTLVTGGWANESDGNVEAPSGYFAKVIIRDNEHAEVVQAFGEEYESISGNEDDKRFATTGFFGTLEDSNGFIWVTKFTDEADLDDWYAGLQEQFSTWDES